MTDSGLQQRTSKPDVGETVIRIRPFGGKQKGTVAPAESWSYPNEVTSDSVVVEYEDRRSRYEADDLVERDGTLFIDKHGFLSDEGA